MTTYEVWDGEDGSEPARIDARDADRAAEAYVESIDDGHLSDRVEVRVREAGEREWLRFSVSIRHEVTYRATSLRGAR